MILLILYLKTDIINILSMIDGKLSEIKSITNPELINAIKLLVLEKIISLKVSAIKLLRLILDKLHLCHPQNQKMISSKMLVHINN